ncbi:site-specific integrase [Planobispora longispora]|uniref:Site-specific integrase n=1 Tax=Planobispora longispora TaxID=28887 RepID=A0A8J3W494_9ACTN|nr:site-specific integrase [Planobispora longispora]BFE85210.1 site-specific integrase [Planobispora longispora]GIH75138.1 site-specific integrase [Planobispora longispora]
MGRRANGEGSVFPYKDSWAGYVWVTTPEGTKTRKWVYGKTREETHEKWLKLHEQASKGPVPTKHPMVAAYLTRWLAEVIEPNREPTTYVAYEPLVRLYIIPGLGKKRLDKLTVRDVQTWLNKLVTLCTCCDQKKDHRRPEGKRKCCALGKCCKSYPSRSTIAGIRRVLRSALGNAVREELISKNVAALATLPSASKTKKKRKRSVWGVDEARKFLEHLRAVDDPLYAAYALILVIGLRRGEVLGLVWDGVDLGGEQLWISHQLNRVGGRLLHRETTKTDDSTNSLPLPGLCVTALKHRQRTQEDARKAAEEKWKDSDLVFTTRNGTPVEPRNFNRAFEAHCRKAGLPVIRVHDTRHTCASLLAALDVHPRVAMRILRHSQISMTMDVYTQIPSPETRKALDRLNRSLGDPSES